MKPRLSQKRNAAMTLFEVGVLIIIIALLATMLSLALAPHHSTRKPITCINNLKQVGLSYRIWAGDNSDKYPMEVSVINGGTMELMNTPEAWKAFQVMSNELSTPKILVCPEDSARGNAATNFGDDLKNRISYFVGVGATRNNENSFLSGDDNFLLDGTLVKAGLVEVGSNAPVAWDTFRHAAIKSVGWFSKTKHGWGNIGLADGSVQSVNNSSLTSWFQKTGLATNRLAIP
jgi:type II secretory pathway pseudopilin PulG